MYIQVFMENIKMIPRGKLAILNCRIDVCLCYVVISGKKWWLMRK